VHPRPASIRSSRSGVLDARTRIRTLCAARNRASLLAAALGLVACGEPTALDIALVADPNVTNAEALAQELRSLRLVIDAAGGLYAPGPAQLAGDVHVEDLDGDGQRELWVERGVAGLAALPRVRVERGGLPDVALDVRLEGKDAQSYVAAGDVQGVRFSDGQLRRLDVVFNLKPIYRAPKVTRVHPKPGEVVVPRSFSEIFIQFSKRMNEESLRASGVVTLARVDGASETPIPPKAIAISVNPGDGDRLEDQTELRYRLAEGLDAGQYRVRVSSDALDASGRRLNQAPMQSTPQPFASGFSTSSEVQPATACNPDCPSQWCSEGGKLCPAGLACDLAGRSCVPQGCPDECPLTTVCDPARRSCVPDCRPNGASAGCAAGKVCAPSGLCAKK
jgi:hypothetical protein